MMNRDVQLNITKSIMYKIISLGCSVYVDDWDEFIINILVCKNCNTIWNKSRTECFYCGTENFHVYKCTECGKLYSITNATQKCSNNGCNGKLVKMCLNDNCPSNTLPLLHDSLNETGGVFEKGKTASCYNEMRCKHCGEKESVFISKKVTIVDEINNDMNSENVLYIKKNTESSFDTRLNGENQSFSSIEEIVEYAFDITLNH